MLVTEAPYIDPDVSGLLVDNEGCGAVRSGAGAGGGPVWDEEGRGEKNQLLPGLGPVKQQSPGTGGGAGQMVRGDNQGRWTSFRLPGPVVTHKRPSAVHPARVMYSVPGKSSAIGRTSRLSRTLTTWTQTIALATHPRGRSGNDSFTMKPNPQGCGEIFTYLSLSADCHLQQLERGFGVPGP